MNFNPTQEQHELLDLINQIAVGEFKAHAFEWMNDPMVPWDNLKDLSDAGILGICLAQDVGGLGRSALDGILAIEAVSKVCPFTGEHVVFAITGPPGFIDEWGTDDQRKRYIPPVVAGESMFSISLSEPEAGSALTDLTTQARIDGDTCTISGTKTFCSFADTSDNFLVFVRFGPGVSGIGAVIVERETPGFQVGTTRKHMGGVSWAELIFDNAEIPVGNVLFDGDAIAKLLTSYSFERCGASAHVLGIAQLALDLSVSYAEQRSQFGRPISDFQMVQQKLADMYQAIEGARLLLYRAVSTDLASPQGRLYGSSARVAAADAASFVTDEAMQIHGGTGMSQEAGLEWLYRMVRPHKVAGGTQEIHRSMIASALVGRKFSHRA